MDQHESLHAYLKESSMARHTSTESTMGEIGLSSEADYISFLRVQASALDALERALSDFAAQLVAADIAWTPRSQAAIADLEALGAGWHLMNISALPDFDHALGVAYTMEGSRLGNAMIFRQFREAHPALAERASAFLGFPTESGFWRNFTNRLNRACPDRNRWHSVLAGSLTGFDTFEASATLELKNRKAA